MPAEAAYFFLQQNDLGVGRGRQDRASSGWSRGTGYGLFCFLFAIHNFVNVYVKVINAYCRKFRNFREEIVCVYACKLGRDTCLPVTPSYYIGSFPLSFFVFFFFLCTLHSLLMI